MKIFGVSGSLLVVGLCACGPGGPAAAVRPTAQTAAQANGEALCKDVGREGRPLVVDWKPEQRGDLEVAMSQGVAVVKYDCGHLELLADCHAEGTYGFKGVVFKQQMIRLSDQDEIKVNLPLSGPVLAAKLEGSLGRGTTLDLATALIGNRVSTRTTVTRADLAGRCDGATHFVRGANIGAFVMQTGESADVATAASIFGAGASAKSASSKIARQEDGAIESCRTSSSDLERPPGQCAALVRLHLVGVAEAPPEAKHPSPNVRLVSVSDEEEGCPNGLVLVEGKCASGRGATAADKHVCKKGDVPDCTKQCDAGDAWSCSRLGSAYASATGVGEDLAKAVVLFTKSCELGHAGGCSNQGLMMSKGAGVAKDDAKAASLFERACKGGDATGCFNLGAFAFEGRGVAKDAARAAKLFGQSCEAGNAAGCVNFGAALDEGAGVTKDPAAALKLFKRACEGDKAEGCTNAGVAYSSGGVVAEDPALAVKSYTKGCALGSAKSCSYLGKRLLAGKGVDKDEAKAKQLLERACQLDATACDKK